jgi:hypothetical protein
MTGFRRGSSTGRHRIIGGPASATLSCLRARTDDPMRRAGILAAFCCIGILMAAYPAFAGDGRAPSWRYNAHSPEPPFPRSARADAVWASDWCWNDCGSYCAWGLAGCLKEDSQGRCLKLTDKCDRYCQRACRIRGGPLLPIEFPWD